MVHADEPTDVETAGGLDDDPPQLTPPQTPTSESASADPAALTDVESASRTSDAETQSSVMEDPMCDSLVAMAEQVLAKRWQCDLCTELHGDPETRWRLGDDRCNHSFCIRCVRGSIQWGGRCPYDDVSIPPIVVCGVMGTGEYLYHEKQKEARRLSGIMCSAADCPGVAPAADVRPPWPVACAVCDRQHCGRRVCGAPWTVGHRCWDIIDEERRRAERRAEQDPALPERHRSLLATRRRLAAGPRFRPCPTCGVMVEHLDGCNMVYHADCRTRWCFACRRIGTCVDFDCRAPGSGPPTPRLRVPPSSVAQQPARKLTKPGRLVAGVVLVWVTVYAFMTREGGVPRSGFLNSVEIARASGGRSAAAAAVAAVAQRRRLSPMGTATVANGDDSPRGMKGAVFAVSPLASLFDPLPLTVVNEDELVSSDKSGGHVAADDEEASGGMPHAEQRVGFGDGDRMSFRLRLQLEAEEGEELERERSRNNEREVALEQSTKDGAGDVVEADNNSGLAGFAAAAYDVTVGVAAYLPDGGVAAGEVVAALDGAPAETAVTVSELLVGEPAVSASTDGDGKFATSDGLGTTQAAELNTPAEKLVTRVPATKGSTCQTSSCALPEGETVEPPEPFETRLQDET
eukprot:TRINITY_DN27670_c0_g1_i2.p1 TRINITY_DN27670_c0_g1~~TRINITY_DN27670_c0_g1_i2.p1  ORF type:complete len:689 (+),score=126.64 TRINITY_DN27670_c0_g1_i2:173-2068(+)